MIPQLQGSFLYYMRTRRGKSLPTFLHKLVSVVEITFRISSPCQFEKYASVILYLTLTP